MRIFFFLCIGVMGFVLPWWLLLMAVVVYALWFYAFELVVWGVIFDVSFGMHTGWIPFPCVYSIVTLGIVLIAENVKPFLRVTSRV